MHLRNPNSDMCALGVVQEKMFMFIAEIGKIFQIDGNRSDARNIHENTRGASEPGRTGKLCSLKHFSIFGSALQRSQGGCKLFSANFSPLGILLNNRKVFAVDWTSKVQLPLIKVVENRVVQTFSTTPCVVKSTKTCYIGASSGWPEYYFQFVLQRLCAAQKIANKYLKVNLQLKFLVWL